MLIGVLKITHAIYSQTQVAREAPLVQSFIDINEEEKAQSDIKTSVLV